MNNIYFLIVLFIIFFQTSWSQENQNKDFEKFLYEIIVTANNDPTKALHLTDSVFNHSTSLRKQSRALLLKASILEKQDKNIKSIEHALKALKFARQLNDYSFEARVYGFLASQSRNIGFYDEGEHFLNKGINAIKKTKDEIKIDRYMAMAYHESAENAIEQNNYSQALDYIKLAISSYSREPNEEQKNFILSNAFQLKGRILINLDRKEAALNTFYKAINLNKTAGAENSLYAGLIFQSIGEYYLKENKIDSAKTYLLRALEISEPSNNILLQELTYGSIADYYEKTGEQSKSIHYQAKYMEALENNRAKKKQQVNAIQLLLTNTPKLKPAWRLFAGSAIFLIVFSGMGVIVFRRKGKLKSFSKWRLLFNNPEKNKLTKKTELHIRKELEHFVKSKQFLNEDLSFPQLTSILKTNSKYLNLFLKTHYDKDYTTYINDLRIKYIMEKLKNDKVYRKYKISYLAKESGFSSHSTFSSNFKKFSGISPSEYIKSL